MTDKLWTIIRQEKLGDAIRHDPAVHDNSSDLWYRHSFCRNHVGQFRVAVCNRNDESSSFSCFLQRSQNVHWSKFKAATGGQELEVPLVLIGVTTPSTAYSCPHHVINVTGHSRQVICSPHGIVQPSISRMYGRHDIVGLTKNFSAERSAYSFLKRAIDGFSSY